MSNPALLAWMMAFIAPLSFASQGIEIGFLDKPGDQLHTLADVIRAVGLEGRADTRVLSIPVPKRFVDQQLLTRSDIEELLHRRVPVIAAHARWSGSETHFLQFHKRSLKKPAWQRASAYLSERLNEVYSDFSYQASVVKPVSSTQLNDGACSIAWEVRTAPLRAPVVCRSENESAVYWFELEIYEQVLVATKDIEANQVVDNSSFGLKRLNVAGVLDRVGELHQGKYGHSSLHKIPRGTILRASQLKERSAINRGDQVRLNVRKSNVALTLTVVALHDANVGQIVSVQAFQPKRRLKAKVLGIGTVGF